MCVGDAQLLQTLETKNNDFLHLSSVSTIFALNIVIEDSKVQKTHT